MFVRVNLGHEEAEKAIQAIKTEAIRRGKAVVVAVSDAHGELLGFLRLDGAPLTSSVIAPNKAFSAARERKPTWEIGKTARDPKTSFEMSYFGDSRFTGWGGGLPVIFEGKVVGAVAVSGLPENEDVALAQVGVDAIIA